MYIESEDHLDHPAEQVYPLVRDQLLVLLPYLPDIEEIIEISRERESDTRLRAVNRWRAKAMLPKLAQKFLPDDIFTWTDRALWIDDENRVDYRLEGFGYEVEGTNYFTPDGSGTKILVTATLTIHPERFKVPKLLFDKVFPLVEGTVKKAIKPNLTALVRGLRSYYADQ